MAVILVRTFIIYIIITVVFRSMGKRQVGELEMSELITTLLLSEIAAMPIDDPDIPLFYAIIPILVIMSFEIIITYGKTRSHFLKRIFESKPIVLIDRGQIKEGELRRMRITLDELLSECRLQGITNIEEVYYAILEQNGKLSLLPNSDKKPVTPSDLSIKVEETGILHSLIIDGEIDREQLSLSGISEAQLRLLCDRHGTPVSDVLLCGIDDCGHVAFLRKGASAS